MMKPKAGHKPKMGPAKPPMGAGGPATSGGGPMQAGKAGGAISVKAPKDIKQFGHKVPGLKELATDRGSFKIKG
jgi:hypothetical protein